MELYLKSIVCTTCLSSNRRLVRDRTLENVLRLFPKYLELNPEEDRVCWECHATLVKLLKFHYQAFAAKRILQSVLLQKEGSVKPLTNLKVWKVSQDAIAPAFSPCVVGNKTSVPVRKQLSRHDNVPIEKQIEPHKSSIATNTDFESLPDLTMHSIKKENEINEIEIHLLETEISEQISDCVKKMNVGTEKKNTYTLENISEYVKELNVGKEIKKNTYIPVSDMRHISIREPKLGKHTSSSNDNLDDDKDDFRSEVESLDTIKKKPSKVASKQAKRRSRRNRNRGMLKDMRVYSNVAEIDVDETQLQEVREKERGSECFLAAKFKCDKCIFGYEDEGVFKAHLNKHKESYGPYVCKICEQRFKEEESLNTHHSYHYRAFVCTVCGFSSRFLQAVVAQCRASCAPAPAAPPGGSAPYTCRDCDSHFTEESVLTWHRRLAHARIECRHCGKQFANTDRRYMHERVHTDSRRVECQLCHRKVKGERGLYHHMKYIHAEQNGALYCKPCKKFFKNQMTYDAHLKTTSMHVPKRYQCDYCGKFSGGKAGLADHIIRLHMKLRRFSCNLCDKKYTKPYDLSRHERVAHGAREGHARERAHMCSECGKAFSTRTVLRKHAMIHTGDKPHQCEYCPWKFTQKSTLQTHQKYKHKDIFHQINKPPE